MWLGHHFQGQKVDLQGAGTYSGGLPHNLLVIPDNWIYYITERWLLLIIENGSNSSIVNNSFLAFFAMQLTLVPVPYGIDLQNLHPTDVYFSWLYHIPNHHQLTPSSSSPSSSSSSSSNTTGRHQFHIIYRVGQNKADCFWQSISFISEKLQMWLICHFVEKNSTKKGWS